MPTLILNSKEINECANSLAHDIERINDLISDLSKIYLILSRMSGGPRLNIYQKLIDESVFHLHQTAATITYTSNELNQFAKDIDLVGK